MAEAADLTQFREETRAWLEANCPPSMRGVADIAVTDDDDNSIWGGRKAQLNLLPMQPGDVARTEADVAETRAALDYAPATPIEAGIAAFVGWYLEYYGRKPGFDR